MHATPIDSGGSIASRLQGSALAACLGAAGLALASSAQAASPECPARGANPDCGQHNMMIVGADDVFLSHLPMFGSEHRFQVILEADFGNAGASLNQAYADDRRKHPEVRMYTLEPGELFVLAELFAGDGEPSRRSFVATVYRGHLERGGKPLEALVNAEVAVERVVYAREIGPPSGPGRSTDLDYILFGRGTELFLAHRITQPPDFDQLLEVDIDGHEFTPDELAKGVVVTASARPNSPERRLRAGETVAAQARVVGTDAQIPLQMTVTAERYFEEGELAAKFTMAPTPLEREAGF